MPFTSKRCYLSSSNRTTDLRYAIYLRKLEIGEEAAVKAGEFKGRYDISIVDAFMAAFAYVEGSSAISRSMDGDQS